jgi:molybdate transport system substrate-binding protein
VRGAAVLAALLLLAGCGGGDGDDGGGGDELVVFAAASLAEVAPAVDSDATVVVGGSNDLAAQIRDGAEAGVFLSASLSAVRDLEERGLVGEPSAFAANRLVLVVPADNPSGTAELADLNRAGIKLVLGAEGVPAGDYAREALAAAGLEEALAQVVSLEDDVRGVLSKVALGEVDAGIVYATDVESAGDDVRSFPIPDEYQPAIRYYAALVEPAAGPARAYVGALRGPEGEKALRAHGFVPLAS